MKLKKRLIQFFPIIIIILVTHNLQIIKQNFKKMNSLHYVYKS